MPRPTITSATTPITNPSVEHTLPATQPHVIVIQQPQALPQGRKKWWLSVALQLAFHPTMLFTGGPVVLGAALYWIWGIEVKSKQDSKPRVPAVITDKLPKPEPEEPETPTAPKPARKGIGGKIKDAEDHVIETIGCNIKNKEAEERADAAAEATAMGIHVEDWWDSARIKEEVQLAKDKPEREAIIAELTHAHYGINPTLPLPELRKQAATLREFLNSQPAYQLKMRQWEEAVEKWKWFRNHGDNAACPKCRNTFRTRIDAKHSLKCRCGYTTSAGNFRSYFRMPPSPREPEAPVMGKGFLGWLLGS